MARIGILGGTFDPIHLGHVRLAEAARERLGLDRVLLVPAARQPLKRERQLAPAGDRLAMARLAAGGRPWIEVSEVELARGGVSYTVETLREVSGGLGQGAELFLIVGADVLADLPRWYELPEILRLARIAAATRPGHALEAPRDVPIVPIEIEPVAISATEVRRRIKSGEPLEGLVDPAVARYISEKGLYHE